MARHPEPTAVPAKIATEARKRLNASASSSDEDVDFSPTMWLLLLLVLLVFSLKEEEEMAAISTSPSFLIDVFSLVALVFVLVWVKRRRRFFHSCIVSPFCCVGFESKKGIE